MNIQVTPHTITLTRTTSINAGEYNITTCVFEFSEEYSNLTKEAVFSTCSTTVKTAILNNQCIIPFDVLQEPGNVLIGVFGYDTDDDELILRYSPKPVYFNVVNGSFKEGDDPDLPAPTEWELVLEQINEAIEKTNNLDITVEKTDHITTITLTKKDGTQETVQIEDGKSLEFNWRGTELGIRQEGQSQYQYVNLKGDKGDAGAIKMIIVAELPETGQEDTIYLVPLETPDAPIPVQVVSGDNTIKVENGDNTQSVSYPINIGNIELCKIGDYQDYIYKNNGKWYLYKKICKITLSNSDNFILDSYSQRFTKVLDTTYEKEGYSNRYIYGGTYQTTGKFEILNNGRLAFSYPSSNIDTVAKLQTYLTTNELYMYLPLSNSTTTEITDTTLISQLEEIKKSYNNQTNISQTNADKPFILDVVALGN